MHVVNVVQIWKGILKKVMCWWWNHHCVEHSESYLWIVDTSLLERAVVGILSAHVAVLAPVTREGAIYTGQTAKIEIRKDNAKS